MLLSINGAVLKPQISNWYVAICDFDTKILYQIEKTGKTLKGLTGVTQNLVRRIKLCQRNKISKWKSNLGFTYKVIIYMVNFVCCFRHIWGFRTCPSTNLKLRLYQFEICDLVFEVLELLHLLSFNPYSSTYHGEGWVLDYVQKIGKCWVMLSCLNKG